MADEHALRLLRQGLGAWNQWRIDNPHLVVDLTSADLRAATLDYYDLRGVDLTEADLSGARAITAQFDRARLTQGKLREIRAPDSTFQETDLSNADLYGADLASGNFRGAELGSAELSQARMVNSRFTLAGMECAKLIDANCTRATFEGAVLSGAKLVGTVLNQASLSGANFDGATLGNTIFSDTDLSGVRRLSSCEHVAPSTVDVRTLQRSGPLPKAFLRGCGFSDLFIDYLPSLFTEAISYHSCFISYSVKDEAFVKRLYADLQREGVRCWYAPQDLRIGDRIRDQIDQSIRIRDKLLIVLSVSSIASQWVEKEVETAMEEERKNNSTVIFPIRLDESVMNTDKAWAADIRRARHIGDFQNWERDKSYSESIERLLRDLRAHSKYLAKAASPERPSGEFDFDDDIPF